MGSGMTSFASPATRRTSSLDGNRKYVCRGHGAASRAADRDRAPASAAILAVNCPVNFATVSTNAKADWYPYQKALTHRGNAIGRLPSSIGNCCIPAGVLGQWPEDDAVAELENLLVNLVREHQGGRNCNPSFSSCTGCRSRDSAWESMETSKRPAKCPRWRREGRPEPQISGAAADDIGRTAPTRAISSTRRFPCSAPTTNFSASSPSPQAFAKLTAALRTIRRRNYPGVQCRVRRQRRNPPALCRSGGLRPRIAINRRLDHYGTPISRALEEVKITTLDSFVAANSIDRIHFLKLDIEGHETRCIAGAGARTIDAGRVDYIQFEVGRVQHRFAHVLSGFLVRAAQLSHPPDCPRRPVRHRQIQRVRRNFRDPELSCRVKIAHIDRGSKQNRPAMVSRRPVSQFI